MKNAFAVVLLILSAMLVGAAVAAEPSKKGDAPKATVQAAPKAGKEAPKAGKAAPKAGKAAPKAGKVSLAAARAQIGACIANPAKMREVVRSLEAADQISFVGEVNEAISKMPGSNEDRMKAYVDANRAAVLGADSGNKMEMIAEVYATVPVVALTVINENFSKDLLNLNGDSQKKYTNDQFTKVSESVVEKVGERCSTVENGAVRSSFAILMMVRASDGAIEGLSEKLVQKLPAEAQNAARSEWLPAALGTNQTKTYEPMLGSVDSERNVGTETLSNDVIIRLAGPQLLESMLGEVVEQTPVVNNSNDNEIYREGVREQDSTTPPVMPPEFYEPGGYQGQNP